MQCVESVFGSCGQLMGKIKTHISGFSSWHHLLFTEFAKLFAETEEKNNFLLIMPPVHCETMSNRFVGVAALLSKITAQ